MSVHRQLHNVAPTVLETVQMYGTEHTQIRVFRIVGNTEIHGFAWRNLQFHRRYGRLPSGYHIIRAMRKASVIIGTFVI